MKLKTHAKNELKILGMPDDKLLNKEKCKWLLDLMDVLNSQDHSIQELPVFLGIFMKLAMYEPLAPLLGLDEEWKKVDLTTDQNIRCSRVFRNRVSGQAYDIRGKVYQKSDGSCFVDETSHVDIIFPYLPKTRYIKI